MKVGIDRLRDLLEAPVWNIAQSFYDQYVEANVRFRQNSGFRMKIIRRQVAKCCDWCAKLAGIYYADNAPDNIYQRHDNCRCMVTTTTERGGYKDAWSKKEFETQREARIEAANTLARPKVIKGYDGTPINYKNVELEYLSKKSRKKGILVNEYENSTKKDNNPEEWPFAKWIHNTFGGDLKRKVIVDGEPHNPDYDWNGKLWDLKTPTTTKYDTLDSRIREGFKQISKRPGGIMMDFTKSPLSYETAQEWTIRIINNKYPYTLDVIIKKGDRFSVFRIIKE